MRKIASVLLGLLLAGFAWGDVTGPITPLGGSGTTLQSIPFNSAAYSFLCNPTATPAPVQDCAATPPRPQGRLTLDSANAVLISDQTAKTTIYYLAYNGGQYVPVYNGTQFVPQVITNGLSLSTADSTNFPASTLIDVYAFVNSGTLTLCGVKWGTSTAGASSRGGSAGITQLNGLWVNSGAWTCSAASTNYTLSTNQATLLGTVAITSTAQQMAFQMSPAAASGGPTNGCWMGYGNLYNTVPVSCSASDSGVNFTSTTTTWEPYRVGGTGSGLYNRVYWVDPIKTINYSAVMPSQGKTGTAASYVGTAIGVNSTTAPTGSAAGFGATTSTFALSVAVGPPPQAGLNYVQALDIAASGITATFVPNGLNLPANNQVEQLTLTEVY